MSSDRAHRLVLTVAFELMIIVVLIVVSAPWYFALVPMLAMFIEVVRYSHRRRPRDFMHEDVAPFQPVDFFGAPEVMAVLVTVPDEWLDLWALEEGEEPSAWTRAEVFSYCTLSCEGGEWGISFADEWQCLIDLRADEGEDIFENALLRHPDVLNTHKIDVEDLQWKTSRPFTAGEMCSLVIPALAEAYEARRSRRDKMNR